MTPRQIDPVAAHMLGGGVDILCEPDLADRLATVVVALAPGGRDAVLHDVGRDAEVVRLQRLNDEVARIAETLARLTREGPRAGVASRAPAVSDRALDYAPPPLADVPAISARDLRAAIQSRRLRDKFLPAGLFEDPAWDMLLDLFAAEIERAQVSVSSLCIAAAVAPTTALRWIGKLTEAGLLEREADPFDRRRVFMALSERARAGLRRYLGAVQAAGLPIA